MHETKFNPEQLVQRIADGDRSAEAELLEHYSRGVRALLRNRVRDLSVADDLFQDTFRIVIEKVRAGAVHSPSRLAGFICSVARNRAIEYFRTQRRQEKMETGSPLDETPSRLPTPLETMAVKSKIEQVRKVLQELRSNRDREILFRFYLEGESKISICERLNLTTLHFNRVLFRARQRYRQLYENHLQSAEGKERNALRGR